MERVRVIGDVLTIAEAARRLQVSVRHLRREIANGALPVIAMGKSGKGDRIDSFDLERYMCQKKRVKGAQCLSTGAQVVPIGGYMSKSAGDPSDDLRKRKTGAKRKNSKRT